jgi:hypothetical protein
VPPEAKKFHKGVWVHSRRAGCGYGAYGVVTRRFGLRIFVRWSTGLLAEHALSELVLA